ncbi:MAG: hypothetical protein QOF62_3008 [Pyrinomonadaceae bacterium]|jgi:hypothetical protein|nr:hypothetical protein [Pyrinomonadaceae bacterium]
MSVTQKSSRLSRLLFVLGGLIIVVLAICFAGWQYYKTTPSYPLALVIDAAQQNDRAGFDRVVNLDRVIDNFITESAQDSGLGLTTQAVTSVREQLQTFTPETSAAVKENVKEEILNRIRELAGPASARPFLVTALAMPFVTEIDKTGDSAKVRINRLPEVELTLERREGANWQIVSLRDQALARRVVSGIVKQLRQSPAEIEQMRKQLRALPERLPQLPLLP